MGMSPLCMLMYNRQGRRGLYIKVSAGLRASPGRAGSFPEPWWLKFSRDGGTNSTVRQRGGGGWDGGRVVYVSTCGNAPGILETTPPPHRPVTNLETTRCSNKGAAKFHIFYMLFRMCPYLLSDDFEGNERKSFNPKHFIRGSTFFFTKSCAHNKFDHVRKML